MSFFDGMENDPCSWQPSTKVDTFCVLSTITFVIVITVVAAWLLV